MKGNLVRLWTVGLALGLSATAGAAAAAGPVVDAAVTKIDQMIQAAKVDTARPGWRTSLPKPRAVKFDPSHTYYARMVTNKGAMRIRLLPDVAPMHVTNFIYLARLGFYDGLTFHRVIPGFMAQGGCPVGNGTGDPGYGLAGEFSPSVKHDRAGILSAANRGPGTDGSQFFLTFVATPWLDGKYTIFGEVVDGKQTLKKLEAAGTRSGHPTERLTIEKVTVEVE